jgi:hypothetical protein
MERRLLSPAEAALLLAPAPATAASSSGGLLSLLGAGRIKFESRLASSSSPAIVLDVQPASATDVSTASSNQAKVRSAAPL